MRKQLEALFARVESLRDAAQEKTDNSEVEKTQDRYSAIVDALDSAIGSIQEAIDTFDDE
jgi:hypothetical protein